MIGTPGSRAICYDAIPNIVYKWKTSKRTVSAILDTGKVRRAKELDREI